MPNKTISSFIFNSESLTAFSNLSTKIEDIYVDKSDYEEKIQNAKKYLSELHEKFYNYTQNSLVIIFQAPDAAGKDGTIKTVFSDINPFGISFQAFKRPDTNELDHDYLWRFNQVLPRRGHWAVFNRSYYEDVIVPQVHPEFVINNPQFPDYLKNNIADLITHRLEDINNYEKYLNRNGTKIIKFYLHLSKTEQAERLKERLINPEKHWKFDPNDIIERNHWKSFQNAYFKTFQQTNTPIAPWIVIPADDKKNMRLLVLFILIDILEEFLQTVEPTSKFSKQEIETFLSEINKQDIE